MLYIFGSFKMNMPDIMERHVYYHFQPIVSVVAGSISHYEALSRLSPYMLSKSKSTQGFVDYLESSNSISIFDEMNVIGIAELIERGGILHPCTVNISPKTIESPGFRSSVNSILSSMNYAKKLHFEITESSPIFDIENLRKFIDMTHYHGCKISLDDFGKGFNQEGMLTHGLEFDFIKIDGSYIRDCKDDDAKIDFISRVSNYCKSNGIQSVAEFIDDVESHNIIKNIGVNLGQGYLYAKPESFLRDEQTIISTPLFGGGNQKEFERKKRRVQGFSMM